MNHLVGGISSAGRGLPDLDGRRLLIARGAGPYLWDTSGLRYVDTALGFGGTILGHAPPAVIEAVSRALSAGPLPAFAHPAEEAAAAALARHTAPLDRVIFVNSGSEAVHLACRAARTLTGRPRIAKFAAAYDGSYDDLAFGNAGSPEAAPGRNLRASTPQMALLRYNDPEDVERLFNQHRDIAAVLVEPVLANAGCVLPQPGYLQHLQATARRHGALVILDEVLMGFRLRPGLTGHALGLDADLAVVGKAIGSGIGVAALVGRAEIMAAFADGRAVRAGTYSGNPVACAAVAATMGELDSVDYAALLVQGASLRRSIEAAFRDCGIAVSTSGYDSVFSLWFAPVPPATYDAALRLVRPDLSLALHLALRREGALVMPSPFGRMFLSFAHDAAAIAALAAAFGAAARSLASAA
jgi:glutamate-1-semialdehyde 2,1-aminomutase